MSEREHSMGRVEVSAAAIASIAYEAVSACYGVVGTAARNLAVGVANAFSSARKRGIEVRVEQGQVAIDVYVIIEYGTRIVAVANSVMNVVKFTVERALGIPVAEVNVHVQGLRISDTD